MCYIPFFRTPSVSLNFSTFWDFWSQFSPLNSIDFSNLVWEINSFCLKNLRKLNQKTFESIFYCKIVKNGLSKNCPPIWFSENKIILSGFMSSIKWEKQILNTYIWKFLSNWWKTVIFSVKTFWSGVVQDRSTSILLEYMYNVHVSLAFYRWIQITEMNDIPYTSSLRLISS